MGGCIFCKFGAGATCSGAKVGCAVFLVDVPAFSSQVVSQDGAQVGSHTMGPHGRSREMQNGIRRNSSDQPVLKDQPWGTLTKLQPVQAINIAPSAIPRR
jgi:hypothetical protein